MKVLFFTPYGARNGAEMMLSYLIKNLPADKFQSQIFLGLKGNLLKELPNVPIHYDKRETHFRFKVADRILNLYGKSLLEKHLLEIHNSFKPDVWYINTLHMPKVAELARRYKIPYIVHFHDMLFQFEKLSYTELKEMVEHARMTIGCAQVVCEKLNILGAKTVGLQYECIDINKVKTRSKSGESLRASLGINTERFLWVMSGTINYRKGVDFIPKIAKKLESSAHILWVGDNKTGLKYFVEKEIESMGLKNVHFVGAKVEDYYDYLSLGDGFLLTSREDPFPLVMIEGAALGKPIVAFDSGGVKEFVKEGMGLIVERLDVEELVKAMLKVQKGEVILDSEKSRARAAEFDVLKQVDSWRSMMENEFNVI